MTFENRIFLTDVFDVVVFVVVVVVVVQQL